ncbi:MAG: family 16 glycosylhydrolase [Candidatus Izimaplasma sp.]|nr:family 16 glycosylhydrolase [Candidatus Izimaplasma bacterium]
MKKIIGIIMLMLLSVSIMSCQDDLTTDLTTDGPTTNGSTTQESTTQDSSTQEITTTKEPYDLRSLVPEECQVIDNIDDWQPVWCDEFDQDGLPNSDNWAYDIGGDGWGNNELQYYTGEDLDNAFVEDGILNIKAIKESFEDNEYTSARLVTKYRGDWTYGRIQVRAKLPEGRGLWPAVWMLPTDRTYGGWPFSGEIDIMEYVGYEPNVIHGTIHTGAYNHGLGTQIGYSTSLPTAEEEFHVYEMIWEPSNIKLFIDGVQFAEFGYNADFNIDIENSDAWPFDKAFHLIINLAVGGDWGGAQGIDDSIFPQTLQVDYVRVFQKDYAGMDQTKPTKPTNLVLQDRLYNSIRIKWEHSTDDVLVSHYNIYVNDQLKETTSLNAIRLYDLEPDTTYNIAILAEDFDGKHSEPALISVTTEDVPVALGVIQAEDYSESSGVRIEQSEDNDDTIYVGEIDDGDYMVYLLEVEEAGDYQINFRVASESDGSSIQLFTLSRFPLFSLSFDSTGGLQEWSTVSSETFSLQEGVFTFRVYAQTGGFNLNYFEIVSVG